MNDNPLCDLNPIFRDYERHLASIERQYGGGSAEGGSEEKKKHGGTLPATAAVLPPPSSSSSSSSATSTPAALFSFTKNTTDESTREKSSAAAPIPAGVTFNFGKKVDSSVLGSLGNKSNPPSFSFSSSSSSSSQTSVFGAPGSAAPLSFSGAKAEDAQPTGQQNTQIHEVISKF